jgi:translation initiation factor 2B subunit (eIF-2B alpha/beta/delta family)
MAQAAANSKVPLYSVCETSKFAVLPQNSTSHKLEPGFDLIPPNLITGIITEVGMIKPNEVSIFRGSNFDRNH